MNYTLTHKQPEDLVLATRETTTVRAFCEMAFTHSGIQLKWKGEGAKEKGIIDFIDEDKFESSTTKQLNRAKPLLKLPRSIFDPPK